ncbi:hypothetical protein CCP3SC1_1090012 [Gammaproteobacteria bacterium]
MWGLPPPPPPPPPGGGGGTPPAGGALPEGWLPHPSPHPPSLLFFSPQGRQKQKKKKFLQPKRPTDMSANIPFPPPIFSFVRCFWHNFITPLSAVTATPSLIAPSVAPAIH